MASPAAGGEGCGSPQARQIPEEEVLLKNWPIIVAGFLLGIGGAVFALLVKSEAQLLIFTLGGVLLLVTGMIMKLQNK